MWNVIDPEFSVDSVFETEKRNDHNSKLGINTWRNPSRVLVETALEKWRSNGLRADNTSVVCVMLDPPNKRNMFKFCRSLAADNSETIESLEGARTIFDYSTSEAYNLDYVSSESYSSSSLARQNASYDLLNQSQNSFYHHPYSSNIDERYFQSSGAHQNYSSGYNSYETTYGYQLASTSTQPIQPGSLTYQTSSNESAFVKACCRNNYLLASANEQIPYHSSYEQHREMYENMALRPYPPLHYAYRPVPASQQLPLPSLHANLYDHQGYLQNSYKPMERYNYLRPTPEEVAALHNEDDETESDSNTMEFSDEESDEEEEQKSNEPEPISTANPDQKESDDSIQIFEISSSSFNAHEETDHSNDEALQFQKKPAKSNNKENSEGSSRKKKSLAVTRGRMYLTRQTDRKMRSGTTGVTKTIGREKHQRRMTRNIRKVVKTLNDQRSSTTSTKTLTEVPRGTKKPVAKSSENKAAEREVQKPALRVLRSADTTFKKQSDEIVNIRSLRSNSSNSNVMENEEKPATRKRTSTLFDNIERNKDRRLK